MLKQVAGQTYEFKYDPAAFRRLCVETFQTQKGRPNLIQPPSGGCVLKQSVMFVHADNFASRLQAAVC